MADTWIRFTRGLRQKLFLALFTESPHPRIGVTTRSEYTADYNGRQSLVTGNRGMLLPVSLKRSNSRLVLASYTKGLQIVATSRRVVSKDGRRMTITTISKNGKGADVVIVGVYEKQRE